MLGDRKSFDFPAFVAKAVHPRGCFALHIEDLIRWKNQVENGLEAGMAKLAPLLNSLHQLIEISFER
ncbi:hypothetical protein D3C84_1188990 [compost metagenome]